jgi:RNA polymerase sigma-70 factor (ECF subfamily)
VDVDAASREAGADLRVALRQAMGQLPARHRAVFLMAAVEGLPHGEIATILEISETNSRTLLLEARRQLQELLTK